MIVLKCTEYQTLNIYHNGEFTSTNIVENTSIKLTTLNVKSKSVAMNYKMDDKEILCTDAMSVTTTQISCNISAVAEVKCRTVPTCCVETNN